MVIRVQRPRAALCGAVSLLALCAGSAANSQAANVAITAAASTTSAGSDADADIVVTGYGASLRSALNNKRNSDLPIESVVAEDLGKMPDQNVSESLQRLPGIQINRSGGKGTAILIDGLRQNLVTLNGDSFLTGKEFYVSGEGSGGGSGANSQYGSLEGVPSGEIAGINVYKNPNASINSGGLGGTVDLLTRDPLAQPMGLSAGGNIEVTSTSQNNNWTPVGALAGSYKFNDRVAITASVSYDRTKTHTEEFQQANRNAWIVTDAATGPYVGALTPEGLSHLGKFYIEPQLAYFTDRYADTKTLGATFGLGFKVTDSIASTFNWFHSHTDETTIDYSNKVWFNGQATAPGHLSPGINPTLPYSIDSNGVVEDATFNANGAETATLYQAGTTNANNYQFVTKFDNGSAWSGTFTAIYAKADSDLQAAQADVEHGLYNSFYTGKPAAPTAPGCNNGAETCTNLTGNHGYQFAYTNGGTSGLPTVSYLAPQTDVLTNPAYVTFKSNWAWANETSQENWAVKGDIAYVPAFLSSSNNKLTAGFRIANTDIDQTFGRYLINGLNADGTAIGNCCQAPTGGTYLYYQDPGYAGIPYSTAMSNPELVKTVTNFGSGQIVVKDPSAGGMTDPSTYLNTVWNAGGNPKIANNSEKLFVDTLSSFHVSQRTYSGYLMADLNDTSGRFHVNFGVRVVNTHLTIDNGQTAADPSFYGTASWNGVNSNNVPLTTERDYTNILPSFNFVLDASETQKIRLNAAQVVAPQDLFALALGNSYNYTRVTGSRVNVNTGLKDGFAFNGGSSGNAELDPYQATQFSAAYENYFAPGSLISGSAFYKEVANFVETQNLSVLVNDDFGGTVSNITKPVNAGSGKIYGFTIAGQYAFNDSLGPWLNGFGIAANYTYVNSSSTQKTSFSDSSQIPGVAKNSYNVTAYYEHRGFAIRASYAWRGDSVNDSAVGSTFTFPDASGVQRTYQVYQAAYGQLDGQISYDFTKRLGILASVQNLTNSAQHTYLQYPNLPFTYDKSGQRFWVGVKFAY
jgi:iron complex outermembrane recepter protein